MSTKKEGTAAGVAITPFAYNYQTAAQWLNITTHKLRRLVELRKIPFVKIGRAVRFRPEDLERYVADRVCPADPEANRFRIVEFRKTTCEKTGRAVRFVPKDTESCVGVRVRPADAEYGLSRSKESGAVMTPPAYNYKTAAECLSITPRQLMCLVADRAITFVKMEREIRFRLEDLENYLTRCIRPVVYEAGVRLTPPPGVGTSQR